MSLFGSNFNTGGWGGNNWGGGNQLGGLLLTQEKAAADTTGPAVFVAGLGALVAATIARRRNESLSGLAIGLFAGAGALITGLFAGNVFEGMARKDATNRFVNASMMGGGFNMMM